MNKTLQKVLDNHCFEHSLTTTEFMVLDALWTHKRSPIQQIGSIVLITSGAITHVLNKLEKIGFISREQADTDKRVF